MPATPTTQPDPKKGKPTTATPPSEGEVTLEQPGDTPDTKPDDKADPPEPVEGKNDPLLSALFRDLEDPENREIKPAEEPDPEDEKPADDNKPTDKPAVEPGDKPAEPADQTASPKKKKKVTILKSPVVTEPEPTQVAQEPTPAPTTTPTPATTPADPDADFVASLNEEQRDELAEAEWAEKNLGEKFKGRRKQLVEFFKKVDDAVQKNPNRTLGDDDEEFQAILKTRPVFDKPTSKKIILGLAKETARDGLKTEIAEQDVKLAEIQLEQRRIKEKPEVDNIVGEFAAGVASLLEDVPEGNKDDTIKTIAEVSKRMRENPTQAAEEHPGEVEAIKDAIQRGKALAQDYTMFARKLSKFDATNENHKWLLDFVNREGEALASHGGEVTVKVVGGVKQTFLPRAKFAELQRKDPDAARKHWTFSHRDVLEMIAMNTTAEAAATIKADMEWAQRRGYTKAAKGKSGETPKPTEDPKPTTGPKAKPTPAKGPGADKGGKVAATSGINVVGVLGMRD